MKDNKIKLNFTIDPKLRDEFYEVSDRLGTNKSKLICNMIRNWIKENNKTINTSTDAS